MPEEPAIDQVSFFDALAAEMNGHADRFEILGDVDIDIGLIMRSGDDFGVRLRFEGIECTGVSEMEDGEEQATDCWLDGPLEAWQGMFDNIRSNGRATGRQTINSLSIRGEPLRVRGADPLGVDKFFRYNQTMQAFFDGAATVAVAGTAS